MMTTLQNKDEHGKRPKKPFAPPTQKLHSMIPHGPNSPKEETLGISCPEAETKPTLPKARLEKEGKTTENRPSSGHENKGKAQDKQPAEKKEKGKSSLTNAEFEEIVQIVLQKSLQECLGMGSDLNFAETSCAQPEVCTQKDKKAAVAAPATDNGNANGEKLIASHCPEISVSVEDKVVLEIRTLNPGQPVPAPAEKKFNRLSLSKRKNEAQDEKMEKTQNGHEHRQKDQLKKMIQDDSYIKGQEKREESGFGQCIVWVQCSFPNCEKWRRLPGNIDPSVLPDNWSCDQNPDMNYNRCDIPEETWTGRETDVAYASYVPGSIIWAKQYGYPWWPGMIEPDPDLGEYFLFASHLDSLPSKYHVTFFGETASRAWIAVNMLKNFQELSLELAGAKKCKNKDYIQKLGAAVVMAHKAEQTSIQERVHLFGFWSRYNGSDSNEDRKDLMPSGANSPEFCLEKEEDSEMEKEEKKGPTLPSPKSAKIQTKKPKPRGMADGEDKTLKKKIMKRSLGSESTAPPAPMMGKEERQMNSDQDQPGPKKKFKVPQSKASAASLSKEEEVRMVPKGLTPPACPGACHSVGKEAPRPQEPLTQEAGSVLPEEGGSGDLDLDLEQLMEDTGREQGAAGQRQHKGIPLGLF